MKSMTGFGKAEASVAGRKIKVEISSVNNRKGLDLIVSVPREFAALEQELRELAQTGLSRGRVTVSVSVSDSVAGNGGLGVNKNLLRHYHRELKALAKELSVSDTVGLDLLLRLPGVLGEGAAGADDERTRTAVTGIFTQALAALQKSRAREGAFLCQALAGQFGGLRKAVADIARRKDAVLARYRENLQKRLAAAALTVAPDDERLLKELVIFSDRCDISEEVTRLRAHFAEARRLLQTADAIGRNLDFLLQEIGREVNTIGSKANDLAISRAVVTLKTELEKIREQAQNLE
ncbi:MAG: YicC family protein [Verrucomicrobiales bacterium]|jgi:uncharacterized protein (TIGR00255 family)|nr:YicC family protein [Verrucomicrobiales bacterium]